MRYVFSLALVFVLSLAATSAHAVFVETITALDLRSSGVHGHDDATATVVNASPSPLSITVTYTGLTLDSDDIDDMVVFTVMWNDTAGNDNARLFGQGADTGFGNINNLVASVSLLPQTTSAGLTIQFDGFTGAAIGAGASAGNDVSASADINGTNASVFIADNGAFRFGTSAVDFGAPTSTVTFDNSTAVGSSVVARHYDLQFSAVPEPSAFLMFGLVSSCIAARRRRIAA